MNNIPIRQQDESAEDYQIRVCELKDKNGWTWQEVADIINNELELDYTESKYRKTYTAFIKGYRRRDEDLAQSEDILFEYDAKIHELRKERYKLQAMQVTRNREDRQDSRFELFYENIASSSERLPLPKDFKYIEPQEGEREYLLTIADIHAGAKFEATNNSYSLDICRQRFDILFNRTVDFIITRKLKKINILSLSDEIQGILRISDIKLNEVPVVEAVVFIQRVLAKFLNDLSRFVRIDYYHIGRSNHTQIRPLGTKASELGDEDIVKIIINYIIDVLSDNPHIKIYTDTNSNYLKFNIFDFKIISTHGHLVSNINTVLGELSINHRENYDYVIVGHSHTSKEIINAEGKHHNIKTLVSPSFIGSCPYADKLLKGSKAMCRIFEFDKKYGQVGTTDIILN